MNLYQTRKAAGLLLQASAVLLFSGPASLADEPAAPVPSAAAPAAPAGDEKRTEQRIEVRVESRSDSNSPDGSVKTQGRVTVIGPDGVKKEYDLNDAAGRAVILQMEGGPEALKILEGTGSVLQGIPGSGVGNGSSTQEMLERVMIGVACEEAPVLLRKHLKLNDAGLVVQSVSDKSPAAEAGIEVDDVLLSLNDVRLQTRDQLVQSVTELENQPVKLQIIRSGEPREVTITPRKMRVPQPAAANVESGDTAVQGFAIPGMNQQFSQVFPGVIIDEQFPANPEAMQRLLKKFGSQAQMEARRAAEAAAGTKSNAESSSLAELRSQIEQLQGDVRTILEELRAAKKQQEQ